MPAAIPTTLYATSAAELADQSLFDAAYRVVSPQRKRITDRIRHDKGKRVSLAAELLLRHALNNAGCGDTPLEFDYGTNGKPYFRQQGLFFNISHSAGHALCALSDRETGCDIEKIAKANLDIAKRFFHEREYNDILAQPSVTAQRQLFYRYWTLKESFVKATGLGLQLGLNSFCIARGDVISVAQSVDKRQYAFHEFDDLPGFACALCTAGEGGEQIALRKVSVADLIG